MQYIKVVFNGEIHIYKHNLVTLQNVQDFIKKTFKNCPEKFKIVYNDIEDDKITVATDDDLQLAQEQYKNNRSLKLHVLAHDDFNVEINFQEGKRKETLKTSTDEDSDDQLEKLFEQKLNLGSEIKQTQNSKEQVEEAPKEKSSKKKLKRDKRRRKINRMLQDLLPEVLAKVKEKQQTKQGEKVIHQGVQCEGCNINPIVGVRYKCSICQVFDYCEKCEKSLEHPHTFYKIKTLKQLVPKVKAEYSPTSMNLGQYQRQSVNITNQPPRPLIQEINKPLIQHKVKQLLEIFNNENQERISSICFEKPFHSVEELFLLLEAENEANNELLIKAQIDFKSMEQQQMF